MRYENWDVLLFPRESKIPMKEFSTSCHAVQDEEPHLDQGCNGVPTLCCFTPSLGPGSPFRVSIHAWIPPEVSQFTKSYGVYHELVKLEARVFVDGRLVAMSIVKRNGDWPHVIANSSGNLQCGSQDPLRFPVFSQEILRQDYWRPGDRLNRIKVVLAEVFQNTPTTPIERVKNVAAFSFQHAPLEILESSSIAWPCPSMWGLSPAPASSVSGFAQGAPESYGYSPQRHMAALQHQEAFGAGLLAGSSNSYYPQGQMAPAVGFSGQQDNSTCSSNIVTPESDSDFYFSMSPFQSRSDSPLGLIPQPPRAPLTMKVGTTGAIQPSARRTSHPSSTPSKPNGQGTRRTTRLSSRFSGPQKTEGGQPYPEGVGLSLSTPTEQVSSAIVVDLTRPTQPEPVGSGSVDKARKRGRSKSPPGKAVAKMARPANGATEPTVD